MEKQLRRYKRKLKDHHKDRNQSVVFIDRASYTQSKKEGLKDSTIASGPIIVAETDTEFPIYSVKEAAEEVERSNLPFYYLKVKKNKA